MGDGIINRCGHDTRARSLWGGYAAFLIYFGLSFLFFGRHLIGHFSDRFIGRDADPTQMMWLLAWWPYALSHHLNPLLTDYVWAPVGFNFAVMTSIPLPAILAWPLTQTIGLVATFNLLMLLTAPLAATAAFALCRRITQWYWPSILGGFVFGFSSYMIGQTLNHFCLLLVFPIPIAAYLVVRWFEKSLGARAFVIMMTATLLAQFLMHPEVFTTATVMGAMVLAVAFFYLQEDTRPRLLELGAMIAACYVITAIILSPYLYYFFTFGTLHQPFWPSERFSTDVMNFILPTPANLVGMMKWFAATASHFSGTVTECDGFIALPLFGIAIVWARRHWSEPVCKTLVVSTVIILVAAIGPFLQIDGHPIAPMPWLVIEHLPLIEHALPARLMVFPPLALGIVLAIWLSGSESARQIKVFAAIVIVLMMLPNLSSSFWTTRVDTPAFFKDGSAARNLSRSDIVLTLPWGTTGQSMLWQPECDMCFRNVAGYTGTERFAVRRWPIVNYFLGAYDLPQPEFQLKAFLANNNVTAIVVDDTNPNAARWKALIASVGVEPLKISGVSLYKLSAQLLADYRTPECSGAEMEQRAFQERFFTLVMAADNYLSSGHDPMRLSENQLIDLSILPQDWRRTPTAFSDMRVMPWKSGGAVIVEMGSKEALAETVARFRDHANVVYLPFPRIIAGTDGLSPFALRLHNALLPPAAMPIDGESMEFLGIAFDRDRLHQAAEYIAHVQPRKSRLLILAKR